MPQRKKLNLSDVPPEIQANPYFQKWYKETQGAELTRARIGATQALEEQRRERKEPTPKERYVEYLTSKSRTGEKFTKSDTTIANIYDIKGFKKEKPELTTVVRKGKEIRVKDVPGLEVKDVKKKELKTERLWDISTNKKGTKFYLDGNVIPEAHYNYYERENEKMIRERIPKEDPLGIR